ncbi:hypothetical protein TTHERM_00558430 (macronuclear) [Tetrahymena thermophila SB210]|uniref:Uncharacterized protein n=1 Tax=Tetrahymena thermophila (strain SB210) TaxID=312017 RepID=I7LWM4_TETTS|nr:hypothetical protein TTHERM_00558430 [Tetrahymena thermophila SB210]EAS02161.2 hypothetical protein TTHERM_00558430 [Tetrahymena thermophila SB210]|eukprot:XP_001022406.2 hypothetical protein TTHERM_00558430 [Tetrahymena thermophila SB210]
MVELKCNLVYLNNIDIISENHDQSLNLNEVYQLFQDFTKIFLKNLGEKSLQNVFYTIFEKSLQEISNYQNSQSLQFFLDNIDFINNGVDQFININLQKCTEQKSDYQYLKELNEKIQNSQFISEQFQNSQHPQRKQQAFAKYVNNIYETYEQQQIQAENFTDINNFNDLFDNAIQPTSNNPQPQDENYLPNQATEIKYQKSSDSVILKGTTQGELFVQLRKIDKQNNISQVTNNKNNNYLTIKNTLLNNQLEQQNSCQKQVFKNKTKTTKIQNSNKIKEIKESNTDKDNKATQNSQDQKQIQQIEENNLSFEKIQTGTGKTNNAQPLSFICQGILGEDEDEDEEEDKGDKDDEDEK